MHVGQTVSLTVFSVPLPPLFLRQSLTIQPWLAQNSQPSLDWSQTDICFPLGFGIKGAINYYAQPLFIFEIGSCYVQFIWPGTCGHHSTLLSGIPGLQACTDMSNHKQLFVECKLCVSLGVGLCHILLILYTYFKQYNKPDPRVGDGIQEGQSVQGVYDTALR